jgi:hypothetical protein
MEAYNALPVKEEEEEEEEAPAQSVLLNKL